MSRLRYNAKVTLWTLVVSFSLIYAINRFGDDKFKFIHLKDLRSNQENSILSKVDDQDSSYLNTTNQQQIPDYSVILNAMNLVSYLEDEWLPKYESDENLKKTVDLANSLVTLGDFKICKNYPTEDTIKQKEYNGLVDKLSTYFKNFDASDGNLLFEIHRTYTSLEQLSNK